MAKSFRNYRTAFFLLCGFFLLLLAILFSSKNLSSSNNSTTSSTHQRDLSTHHDLDSHSQQSKTQRARSALSAEQKAEDLLTLPPGGMGLYQISSQTYEKLTQQKLQDSSTYVDVVERTDLKSMFTQLIENNENVPFLHSFFFDDLTGYKDDQEKLEELLTSEEPLPKPYKKAIEELIQNPIKDENRYFQYSVQAPLGVNHELNISGTIHSLPDHTRRMKILSTVSENTSDNSDNHIRSQETVLRFPAETALIIRTGEDEATVILLSDQFPNLYQ